MRSSVRKYLLPLHRWTALSIGLVIVVIAATGAAMVFRPQLEGAADRDLSTVPACATRLPIDELVTRALDARPGSRLDDVHVFASTQNAGRIPATMVRFKDELRTFVYVNPCTGEVLGTRARFGGVFGTLERIHRFRFVKNGSVVSGTCVLMFVLVLLIGGIALWWPASRSGWKKAFRFDRRLPEPARAMNLHKTVGVYAAIIPLVSALTGLPLSFGWYEKALYAVTSSSMPEASPRSSPAPGAKRLPIEAFWRQVQAIDRDVADALIRPPVKPEDSVEIFAVNTGAPHPNAYSHLYLDAYSGKVLSYTPYRTSSTGNKLYFWMLSVHTGLIGGVVGQLLLLTGCLAVLVLAYTGIGTFIRRQARQWNSRMLHVRVARKTNEARGICSFELVAVSGRRLPRFSAGAHIDVHVREGLVRQYSLCNHPAERHRYLIAVQRVVTSRGGSEAMHEIVQQGDIIEIGSPRNHFPLAKNTGHTLLLAGGIGITPILSMAEKLAGEGQSFEMHYCVREAARAAFVERIKRSAFADNVFFHFSEGPPEQRIDIPALLRRQPDGTHLYVCGPASFMDTAIGNAIQLGWPEANLHREYFAGEVKTTSDDTMFDVRIASTGEVFHIPPGKSVLRVLSDGGIEIPHFCEQGVCGTCATRVLDGTPDHRDLCLNAEDRQRKHLFTPCCSRAHSTMLLLDL
jgi:ferredoxin-NADP reductase